MTATTTESIRLFFALWPDDETRAALQQLQSSIHGRKVAYSNLHLTLAFLGQQPVTVLPALTDVLTHLPPLAVTLQINQVGYFPRNRVAWAGMSTVPITLLTLQEEVTQALAQAGIAFNNQHRFRPHITLARDASLPSDLAFNPIEWRAEQIALVQSEPNGNGTCYRVLESRSLERKFWTAQEIDGNAVRLGR